MPEAVQAEREYDGVIGTGHSTHCPFCGRINIATKSPQNPSHYRGLWCTHSNGVTQGAEGPVFVFDTVGVDKVAYKGKYPLHTTGKNLSDKEVRRHVREKAQEDGRYAIWFHVDSSRQRQEAESKVSVMKGWEIVGRHQLPDYFVLAVREDLDDKHVVRLINTIQPSQDFETVDFLGKMFGYEPEEIEWYKDAQPRL